MFDKTFLNKDNNQLMHNVTKSRSFKWSVTTTLIAIIAWMLTWRFYAMWWFILAFIDLAIFVLFISVFFGSIIFLMKNIKKFTKPFIPLCINTTAIIVIICAPSINLNKNYYKSTTDLYDQKECACHLYIETYCVYGGGAWGSDVDSHYLTDSTNFRIYLGAADEEGERISVKCKGDCIDYKKIITANLGREWNQPKTIEQKRYSIKDLKK